MHGVRSLPRPPWILVVCALAFVGVLVWWFTSQGGPGLDAQRVIDAQLQAAQKAAGEGHYSEPYEGSALHHYTTVLAIDATNPQAMAGVKKLADQLIASARTHLDAGLYADAVIALNSARRIDASHRGLAALEGDLRKELQRLAVRAPAKAAPAATKQTATAANRATPPATKASGAQKKETVAGAELAKASAPSGSKPASGSVSEAAAKAQAMLKSPDASAAGAGATVASASAASPPSSIAEQTAAGALTLAAATQIPPAGAHASPSGSADIESGSNAPDSTSDVTVAASKKPQSALPPIVKYVPPQYPDEARVRGIQGWADLSFLVGPNGDVVDPRLEDSSRRQLFGKPALSAIRKWRYQPPEPGHPALTERTRVRVEFQLQ